MAEGLDSLPAAAKDGSYTRSGAQNLTGAEDSVLGADVVPKSGDSAIGSSDETTIIHSTDVVDSSVASSRVRVMNASLMESIDNNAALLTIRAMQELEGRFGRDALEEAIRESTGESLEDYMRAITKNAILETTRTVKSRIERGRFVDGMYMELIRTSIGGYIARVRALAEGIFGRGGRSSERLAHQ